MIRLTLLSIFIFFLAVYSWRDWYKSLCGLIVLMAVVEHPDMPKSIFGVQGLNPWNMGFLVVFTAWRFTRGSEGLRWDMPKKLNRLLLIYLGVVLVSFFRMIANKSVWLADQTTASLVSECLVNCVKWVIPGLMLFDGCRDENRFKWGLAALLLLYFLLAVQVIRWMPISSALSGEELRGRSLKIILNEIGYHRVNMSMMLAGASWAIFAARPIVKGGGKKFLVIMASFATMFGQALTGGRTGYGTWAVVGIGLCLASSKWRKFLLLIPLLAAVVAITVPGVKERMLAGFTPESRDYNNQIKDMPTYKNQGDESGPDEYTVTAGRNVAWPLVIAKIGQSPVIGYGRLAMQQTGIAAFLLEEYGEVFPHPHNAYLEMLLDNGLIGFLLVLPFYLVTVKYSLSLFRDMSQPEYTVIGGVAASLLLALLVASMGSQTFYPREGSVGMWCAIGLMLRMHVQRNRASDKRGLEHVGIWGSAYSRSRIPVTLTP